MDVTRCSIPRMRGFALPKKVKTGPGERKNFRYLAGNPAFQLKRGHVERLFWHRGLLPAEEVTGGISESALQFRRDVRRGIPADNFSLGK